MLYLPKNTTKAVCMEMPNADGSMRWWICALAYGHEEDICFSCWGNHTELSLGYTAQGKTLCFDIESQGIFRRKIEEKLSKGYQTISQFDGLWSTPLSKPITQLKQGKLEGKFGMANPKGTDFRLELYRCNDGFRIDHYENDGVNLHYYPNYQTLYQTHQEALTALNDVREKRFAIGYRETFDIMNWNPVEFVNMAEMVNATIAWDF